MVHDDAAEGDVNLRARACACACVVAGWWRFNEEVVPERLACVQVQGAIVEFMCISEVKATAMVRNPLAVP